MFDPEVEDLIHRWCPPERQDACRAQLSAMWTALGYTESQWDKLRKRLFMAIIKISQFDDEKLYYATELAKTDWRDLLVVSGFELDLEAHERWYQSTLPDGRRSRRKRS